MDDVIHERRDFFRDDDLSALGAHGCIQADHGRKPGASEAGRNDDTASRDLAACAVQAEFARAGRDMLDAVVRAIAAAETVESHMQRPQQPQRIHMPVVWTKA